MRVACPGCATVYEPPAERLKPGLRLRCSACGEMWSLPGAPAETEEPAPDAAASAPPPVAATVAETAAREGPVPELPVRESEVADAKAAVVAAGEPAAPRSIPDIIAARRIALAPDGLPPGRLPAMIDSPPPERSPAGVVAGWLATAAVLGGLAWGAYTYRGEVMAAWPPSTRVYAGLGLAR